MYEGPFSCGTVQYMTAGIGAGILLVIVVVVACCHRDKIVKRLRRQRRQQQQQPDQDQHYIGMPMSIYREMPYGQVNNFEYYSMVRAYR